MTVECRDCRALVSSSAKTCPQCGAKDPNIGKFGYGLMHVLGAVIVLAIGWFFWSVCISGDSDEPRSRPVTTRAATTTTISGTGTARTVV